MLILAFFPPSAPIHNRNSAPSGPSSLPGKLTCPRSSPPPRTLTSKSSSTMPGEWLLKIFFHFSILPPFPPPSLQEGSFSYSHSLLLPRSLPPFLPPSLSGTSSPVSSTPSPWRSSSPTWNATPPPPSASPTTSCRR